jgi:D-glycero-alpha-D-manno-heptose-7-phosphate kinase
MQVTSEGSVRVDLVGGTLDIPPIHLILKDVKTLNLATSLKAKAILTSTDRDGVEIISKDYDSTVFFESSDFTEDKLFRSAHFGPLNFVAQILHYFGIHSNLILEISSKAPAGSGLGGSSTMGVTLYKGLCEFKGLEFDKLKAIKIVRSIESRILNKGVAGYQDYYPALFSGILSLKATVGEVEVEQVYSTELKEFLEDHITLVFSGDTRLSGINNWEVYKSFFDGDEAVRAGMANIAKISNQVYDAIKAQDFSTIIELISLEGIEREKLFPNIVPANIKNLFSDLQVNLSNIGLKMCGAGGGGCFIILHQSQDKVEVSNEIKKFQMKELEFKIESPHE